MDITLTLDIAQLLFTFFGGLYALFLFRQSNVEKRNQFIIQIYDRFYNDKEIREILYSIDKGKDLEQIRYDGELETQTDKTLRFLDLIGQLIKDRQINKRDIYAFRYEIRRILDNKEIKDYLIWLNRAGVVLNNLSELYNLSDPKDIHS